MEAAHNGDRPKGTAHREQPIGDDQAVPDGPDHPEASLTLAEVGTPNFTDSTVWKTGESGDKVDSVQ